MRRVALAGLALAALVVLVRGPTAPTAGQEPAQNQYMAHLPLTLRDAHRPDLGRPPAVTPTVTPTAVPATTTPMPSPTETATSAPTPTATPVPPTDTPAPTGRVVGRLLVNGEPAVEGLGLYGPALWLRRCSGPDCTTLGRSGVLGQEGVYTFEDVPALQEGAYYQVTWQNEDAGGDVYGHPELLGSWYGLRITAFDGTGDVSGGDIELMDIALVRPTHGTGFQGLPIPFEWRARPFDEIYRWGLMRGCGLLETRKQSVILTESLGRGTKYELNRYPPGVVWGNDNMYCWFVRLETPDGYGESYYTRMMWFIPVLLPPWLGFGADPSGQDDVAAPSWRNW